VLFFEVACRSKEKKRERERERERERVSDMVAPVEVLTF
jgi:hypothetical protein